MSALSKPPVISKTAFNFDCRSKSARKITTLVLYDTGSNNGRADLARLRDPYSGISAHYLVDRDGSIYQLVAEKDRAWFRVPKAQRDEAPDRLCEHSLCVEVVTASSDSTHYPLRQREALERLVKYLMARYSPDAVLHYNMQGLRRDAGSLTRSIPKHRASAQHPPQRLAS